MSTDTPRRKRRGTSAKTATKRTRTPSFPVRDNGDPDVYEMHTNQGMKMKEIADTTGVDYAKIHTMFWRQEVEDNPDLKVTTKNRSRLGREVKKMKDSGLRWEKIMIRTGLSRKELQELYAEASDMDVEQVKGMRNGKTVAEQLETRKTKAKKAKKAEKAEAEAEEDEGDDDEYGDMTVAELRALAKERGLPTRGSKAALIEALEASDEEDDSEDEEDEEDDDVEDDDEDIEDEDDEDDEDESDEDEDEDEDEEDDEEDEDEEKPASKSRPRRRR